MSRIGIVSIALLAVLFASGETCSSGGTTGNRAPAAPTVSLHTVGTTVINGTVSACVDDRRPSGSCTQEAVALIPGTVTVMARSPVSGGRFELSGLSALTRYSVIAGSFDTEYQTWGNQIDITTVGTTGPFAFGITPTELVVPGDVWIEGIDLDAFPTIAKLIDATTGQERPAAIELVKGNRARIHLDKPSDLTGRRRYFLWFGAGKKAQLESDVIHLSSNSSALSFVGGQKIRVHYVRWHWSRACPMSNREGTVLGPPFQCGCWLVDRWEEPSRTWPLDPWPDEWTDSGWGRFKTQADDSSREWSAMCSLARNASIWVKGIAEAERRVTLPASHFYWLEIATGSAGIEALARRLQPFSLTYGTVEEFCRNVYVGADVGWSVPDDCTLWQPNQNGRITVHLVGAFYFGGQEVDPAIGSRGYANPPEVAPGMVILTDNPFRGARPRIRDSTPSAVCKGDVPAYEDTSSALHQTYWWGPPEGRDYEFPPNLLAHELHHVTTGYAHGGSDPCFTPAVGEPDGSCPRGLNMDLGSNSTVSSECDKVFFGYSGRDYTQ